MELEQLVIAIQSESFTEIDDANVEFKESWAHKDGRDLSALANNIDKKNSYLVIGVTDSGKIVGKNKDWCTKEEHKIGNNLLQHLTPTWSAQIKPIEVRPNEWIIVLIVINPGDLVTWEGQSYILVGTHSRKMVPEEISALVQRMPGADFTKTLKDFDADAPLVMEFAKKTNLAQNEFIFNLNTLNSDQVLSKLDLKNKCAGWILFGKCSARICYYNDDGDIINQDTISGLYTILSDTFLNQIQTWTSRKGAALIGNTASLTIDTPYPIEALREVLANAVAHACFSKESGGIFIELHPTRLSVKNFALRKSRTMSGKWFSRESLISNKLLTSALRFPKATDEAGNGKFKIFRHALEAGKPLPLAEIQEIDERIDRWSVTLYSGEVNKNLLALITTIKERFSQPDEWRLATALVLWKDQPWNEIQCHLDDHFKRIALKIFADPNSPVAQTSNKILLRRWAEASLLGQITKTFTAKEENDWLNFLRSYVEWNGTNGIIEFSEIRTLMGMRATNSENTQLSNLLRRWEALNEVKNIKKGLWMFLKVNANTNANL